MRILKSLFMLLILCILALPAVAQDNSLTDDPLLDRPHDATALTLVETPLEGIEVRLTWAFVTDTRVEIGWEVFIDPMAPYLANAEMELFDEAGVSQPKPQFPIVEITPRLVAPHYRYVSVFQPELLTATTPIAFTAIVHLTVVEDSANPANLTVIPVPFSFSAPLTQQLRWEGMQTVEVNGYNLTLHAIRHDPRLTELDFCFPFIHSVVGAGDIYHPYIVDDTFRPLNFINTRLYRAGNALTIVAPEATAEPNPLPADTSTADTVCSTIVLYGFSPSVEGQMRVTIDELRSRGGPSKEATPLIAAAMASHGMSGSVAWDDANGFGMSGPGTGGERDYFRKMWRIISDVTSERILGPWVFGVTVE